MQIAESSYPQSHQEAPSPPPQPPPFSLAQPLSPVLAASEQMQYSPFLGQYPEMPLRPLTSSPGSQAHLQQPSPPTPPPPPPPPQQSGAAPASLQFSYQTCELPGTVSPEPDYPTPHQYPLDGAQQGSVVAPDCPRSSGLQGDPSSYDPLTLSEFPGLFDCEMLEAVDPQHSGYVLVN